MRTEKRTVDKVQPKLNELKYFKLLKWSNLSTQVLIKHASVQQYETGITTVTHYISMIDTYIYR